MNFLEPSSAGLKIVNADGSTRLLIGKRSLRLVFETAAHPPSFYINPPVEAFKYFESVLNTEMAEGISAVSCMIYGLTNRDTWMWKKSFKEDQLEQAERPSDPEVAAMDLSHSGASGLGGARPNMAGVSSY